jgi:hypothetical protein
MHLLLGHTLTEKSRRTAFRENACYSRGNLQRTTANPKTIDIGMKYFFLLACLLTICVTATGQKHFRHTESYPRLRIKAVSIPQDGSDPLKIRVTLQCIGSTPLALSQDQFSVQISTQNDPMYFLAEAIFPAEAPKKFYSPAKRKANAQYSDV